MNPVRTLTAAACALLLTACGTDRAESTQARRSPAPPDRGAAAADPGERFAGQGRAPAGPVRPDTPAGTGLAREPAQDPAGPGPALDPRLLDPAAANETAPERYSVELDTTKGPIIIDVTRSWTPTGADRFYNLVRIGYFTDVAFFRVIEGFMAQAGIHGDPRVNAAWRSASIQDDPPTQSNTRGMVTFAKTMLPNSRNQQFFISFGDNSNLDPMGFAPFGRIRPESMAVADRLHAGYGEGAPQGRGPMQARFQMEGNPYLRAEFPELDYVRSARVLE